MVIDKKSIIDLNEKTKIAETGRKNVLFDSEEIEGLSIKGFDFNSVADPGMNSEDYARLLDSYLTTGFQATHFAKAIEIINKMIKEKVTIYLGYTSNMVSSGLRDIFRYLTEHKKVDVIVTTAGGIEEDFIKCFGDFKLGKFSESGELLAKKGVNRTGNIYVPNERYCRFEDFIVPVLEKIYKEQIETGKIISVSELIKRLGKEINDKRSIYYWCYKNDIDVYCPAITDGSFGDMIHFFMYEHPDFKIDVAKDIHKLNEYTITRWKTGVIILGKGIMKHHILNANMMRNGADYGVYINTGEEWDGADSNARPDEAVSWGKLKGGKGRDEKDNVRDDEKLSSSERDYSEDDSTEPRQDSDESSASEEQSPKNEKLLITNKNKKENISNLTQDKTRRLELSEANSKTSQSVLSATYDGKIVENKKNKMGSNGMEPSKLIPGYDIVSNPKYLNVSVDLNKSRAGMVEWLTQPIDTRRPFGHVGLIPTAGVTNYDERFIKVFGDATILFPLLVAKCWV